MPTERTPAITGSGITPEMPTEPPDSIKKLEFTFDPNFASRGVGESTVLVDHKEVKTDVAEVKKDIEKPELVLKEPVKEPVKEVSTKKEEPKKEEVKKEEAKSVLKPPTEEVKKEDKPVVKAGEEVKKEIIKPITPVKEHKDDAFDYTGFTPQEQTNLKNMSRQSREYAAGLIKENKQIAALKESTYLQHEQGYTLSPEFQQLQTKGYYAETERKAWQQALLNVKSGKPFRDIVGWEKDGTPKLGPEIQPSDTEEIRLADNMSRCSQVVQQLSGELQNYPNRFKQQIQQDMQAVESVRKERFAWVADPKLLDYSVAVEGQGDKKLRDVKSDFKSMLPVYWQSSPIAEVASDLFVAMIIQGAELREARNGQTVAQIKTDELKRGEPTSETSPVKPKNGIEKGIPDVFSLEGMPTR